MNIKEAYKTLGLEDGADKDAAKKAFRRLAKQYHPDNKETGNEAEFKKVNEAFQTIENPPSTQPSSAGGWNTVNFADFFGGFGGFNVSQSSRPQIIAQDITVPQTLSFREAVLGCNKDIKYVRNICCSSCSGEGRKTIDNGCSICHGVGKTQKRTKTPMGEAIMESLCPKCRGKVSFESCKPCNGQGFISSETLLSINIPPGAVQGSVLNLGTRGHYVGNLYGSEQYTRLSLLITVIPQEGLSLRDRDVVCSVSISLLEALKGCSKTISTVDGEKEINIPALIKNKEEVLLPNLGVGRKGNQVAVISIEYPKDVSSLISSLSERKPS